MQLLLPLLFRHWRFLHSKATQPVPLSVLQTSCADSPPQCYLSVSFGLALAWGGWQRGRMATVGFVRAPSWSPAPCWGLRSPAASSANQRGTKKYEKPLILLYIHWPSAAFGCRWCFTQASLHSLMNTKTSVGRSIHILYFVKAWTLQWKVNNRFK